MKKKFLIMGLPGSGKTTLAKILASKIDAEWLNADQVRKEFNDWDFTLEGTIRQAKRMRLKAENIIKEKNKNVLSDFICPTPDSFENFKPDYTIWVDTIKEGRFEDTNKLFVPPSKFDFKVTSRNAEFWAEKIAIKLNNLK